MGLRVSLRGARVAVAGVRAQLSLCGFVPGRRELLALDLDARGGRNVRTQARSHQRCISPRSILVRVLANPDESKAFDLGLHLPEKGEQYDGITDKEVETALRMFNSFRTKRGKSKLTLDARLVLSANELATTCRDVPFTSSMEHGEGYEFFPTLSLPLQSRGFNGEMHAVSVAAPLDSSVKHAIEWWTSAVDPKTGVKPFFLDDVAVVGLAKSSCKANDSGTSNSPAGTVWTLLLAKSD